MLSFSIMYKCVSVLGRSVCIFVCKCVSCVFASLFVGVFMFVGLCSGWSWREDGMDGLL